jgi:hypothetical protein
LVIFLSQRDKLMPGILVLPQRRDGLPDFLRIDLGDQICADHDGVSIEPCADLLIQDEDQPSRIGSNLVFRDSETVHDCDAF